MDDPKKQNSSNMIIGAIHAIKTGHMDPWFHRRQTAREWCSKLEPTVCASMSSRVVEEMIALRLDNRHNAGARMCDLLVYMAERGKIT